MELGDAVKYLDYVGDLFYGVHHDFSGNPHWQKKTAFVAFLYGSASLEQLKKKKIAVLGTGEHSLWCTELLGRHGIEISAYCDNDPQMVGKLFFGKQVVSPFDLFETDTYHLIAAPDQEHFEPIADQFAHCGVKDYSFFFHADTIIDFKDEEIRTVVMAALNCLINNEYSAQIHKNAPMGITLRLLPGLEWWSQELYWLRDDLKAFGQGPKVLDIGPGFGFVSLIIKLMRPQSNIHWLSLAVEDSTRPSFIDPATKRYPITQKFGMIEDPEYRIDEQYDCIIMTEVFEHFGAAPDVTLKKIASMLGPNGRIYLSTPNWENENLYRSWREIPPFSGDRETYYKANKSRIDWMDLNLKHTYFYTEKELYELSALCGLEMERFVINDCNNFNCVLKRAKP
ncbi:Methyltransferase domain-containing protein [Oscillibacter sp. PC13]|nr:Methyltransferase domain-containing protein [Oscillibacter sp. PC13]